MTHGKGMTYDMLKGIPIPRSIKGAKVFIVIGGLVLMLATLAFQLRHFGDVILATAGGLMMVATWFLTLGISELRYSRKASKIKQS